MLPTPSSSLDPAVEIGAPIVGSYTVDPVVVSTSHASIGSVFHHLAEEGSLEYTVAGVPFENSIVAIEMINDASLPEILGADSWGTVAGSLGPDPFGSIFTLLGFVDFSGTRYQEEGDEEDFFFVSSSEGWDIAGITIREFRREGVVEVAQGVIMVPEPAALTLLCCLLVLGGRRRG